MGIEAELLAEPGVLAVGKFAYRGDRFLYKGQLSEEQARWVSIVCRATSMSTAMQGRMLATMHPETRIDPLRGWVLGGARHTLLVMTNVFCLLDAQRGSMAGVLAKLRFALADESTDLV